MDDLLIPLWPPPWVEDHTLDGEQLVAAGEEVRLMTAVRDDERILMSVSWPGGRRYLMVALDGEAPAEAFRAGDVSEDTQLARAIDEMWTRALRIAKHIQDGDLPAALQPPPDEEPPKRRGFWRRG